jgi:hypothetical protein
MSGGELILYGCGTRFSQPRLDNAPTHPRRRRSSLSNAHPDGDLGPRGFAVNGSLPWEDHEACDSGWSVGDELSEP